MQQTENYQLKLIEPADDLSPEPLNDNARRVDELLGQMALRSFVGDGKVGHAVDVGFKPGLVILFGYLGDFDAVSVAGPEKTLVIDKSGQYFTEDIQLTETGFVLNDEHLHNRSGKTQYYIAFR